MSETIRAFVAIELSDEIKSSLGKLIAKLKMANLNVRWVNPESIHLTLKFLGNIEPRHIDNVTQALIESSRHVNPFVLSTGKLGAFPNLKSPRVLWIGLNGNLEHLVNLQQRVAENLTKLDFDKENRAFSPHLTLARLRDYAGPADGRKVVEALSQAGDPPETKMTVDHISLMKSTLTPSGAIYSRLVRIKLGR